MLHDGFGACQTHLDARPRPRFGLVSHWAKIFALTAISWSLSLVFLNEESLAQVSPQRGGTLSGESGMQVGPRAFRIPQSPMWFVIRAQGAGREQVAIYDEVRGADVAQFETSGFTVNRARSDHGAAVMFPNGVDAQGRASWTALVGFAGGAIVQADGIQITAAGAASAFVLNSSRRPVFLVFDENDAVVRWAIQVRPNRSMGGGGVSAEQRLPWNEFIDAVESPFETGASRILNRAMHRVRALNPNDPALGFVDTLLLPPPFDASAGYQPHPPIEDRAAAFSGRSRYGLPFLMEPPADGLYREIRESNPSVPGLYLATDYFGRTFYVVDEPGRGYRHSCISYFGTRR